MGVAIPTRTQNFNSCRFLFCFKSFYQLLHTLPHVILNCISRNHASAYVIGLPKIFKNKHPIFHLLYIFKVFLCFSGIQKLEPNYASCTPSWPSCNNMGHEFYKYQSFRYKSHVIIFSLKAYKIYSMFKETVWRCLHFGMHYLKYWFNVMEITQGRRFFSSWDLES